jgi:hypothetical protein
MDIPGKLRVGLEAILPIYFLLKAFPFYPAINNLILDNKYHYEYE